MFWEFSSTSSQCPQPGHSWWFALFYVSFPIAQPTEFFRKVKKKQLQTCCPRSEYLNNQRSLRDHDYSKNFSWLLKMHWNAEMHILLPQIAKFSSGGPPDLHPPNAWGMPLTQNLSPPISKFCENAEHFLVHTTVLTFLVVGYQGLRDGLTNSYTIQKKKTSIINIIP